MSEASIGLKEEETPVVTDLDSAKEVYTVYRYRWAMLLTYSFAIMTSNFQLSRFAPLTQEFAEYFNTTNEVAWPDEPGIDFIGVSGSFYAIFFFPFSGYLVAKYGLQVLTLGTISVCVGNWWYYLSFTNFSSFLAAKCISTFGNCCIVSSLLRLVSHWFPPRERSLAIAVGAMIGPIGAGLAFGVGDMFKYGNEVVDVTLKSCESSFKSDFNQSELEFDKETELPFCFDEAEESFCCFTPTNIEGLNLLIALVSSVVVFFSLFIVRDVPPSPVAASGKKKEAISFIASMKLLLHNVNYVYLCIADLSTSALSIFGVAQIAVYELKSEYVYRQDVALYGHIVATDRFISNLSGLIFLSAFPPERLQDGFISGREFTFYICAISASVAVFLFWRMPNKRDYRRMVHDQNAEEETAVKVV
eukprot:augustus_masked-scaffold_39-processed-gene-0.26-mRNA-1 protein AED:1.00 eAED:1.00 QI:0/0/0/0/1/1/2/0/416